MKRIFSLLMPVVTLLAGCRQEQTGQVFTPYAATDLRLPAVPLIVSDPYLSIWSVTDNLPDGTTRHWTEDEKPLTGLLRVDGQLYRFMGAPQKHIMNTIAPMADEARWEARTSLTLQAGWQQPDFDDQGWKRERGAFGSTDHSYVGTRWSCEPGDIYIRRPVSLTAGQLQGNLYLKYSHDDVTEIYVNGNQIVSTGFTWRDDVLLQLTDSLKAFFHEGQNIIAAHCHNTVGSQYIDFGLFSDVTPQGAEALVAGQKSVDVLATNTYYTFACGPVELDVVFTAPMVMEDCDLLSTPVNYISYQVRSADGAEHDVQFYLGTNPQQGINRLVQPTVTETGTREGLRYARTGSLEQPVLAKAADHICIDWGYFYLPAINGQVAVTPGKQAETVFAQTGALPQNDTTIIAHRPGDIPTLAYVHDFGKVKRAASFALVGYDEVDDIEYMHRHYKGYWARDGKTTILQAFNKLNGEYANIMQRCRETDKTIYDDGMASGGKEYAEVLSASYRQVMAAHKLFQDDKGNLLWFSKENDSNGCVNTVDVTYPSVPLFLLYNPSLVKGMLTSIFDFSLSGKWNKPYPSHDLGRYPQANGNFLGDQGMPVEEAGNMLILSAVLCEMDGNTDYVKPYWGLLDTWARYLAENGLDPANQLCTDDFTGFLAHNCNLSVKSTLGIMAYSKLLAMKGDRDGAAEYEAMARQMARTWEERALDGDHYRLAFDRDSTWSQKYNMVWDKMWGTGLFSDQVMERELAYYLKMQNRYGLPLDCRADFTKSDWVMWTAAMAPDTATFRRFLLPVYDYINESESRVPISDWHETKTARRVRFKARSVIGGYWMKVLMDKAGSSR